MKKMWWLIGSAPDYRGVPGSNPASLIVENSEDCTMYIVQYSTVYNLGAEAKKKKKGELAANGLAKRLF